MSADSGLKTFRDSGGLWEGHDVMQVASPEAYAQNPELVLEFYNQRRRQLHSAVPNAGHRALASLESHFEVEIITQNVDDLHERGGAGQVCHMHGQLRQIMCNRCHNRDIASSPYDGTTPCSSCGHKGCLRPDVVWFGEVLPYDALATAVAAAASGLEPASTSST